MPRGSNDQGDNNWHHLWESNRKSRLQATRARLQQLSTSLSSPGTLSVPPFSSDSSKAIAMSINPMIQSPEDQFLYWHQDLERKQEEQARQMKKLQSYVEQLHQENDQLRA